MQENNSQNANIILKRLKKSLKISTDIELSVLLNIKPNTISTWKKRNSVDFSSIIAICELYEIDLNEIFYEKKIVTNNSNSVLQETPLVCSEVQYQYCIDKEGLIDNLPKFSFPFIKSDDTRVFQVTSNNMFPSIEQNSFVVCELSSIDILKNNSLAVVISKSKGFFINRVSRSTENNDVFVLINENSFFNNVLLNASDIDEIWQIKGVLSYNIKEEEHQKAASSITPKPSTKIARKLK
ncbi:LexA family transcriptional regulator [Flavobacterium aquatile]|uniref:LexA family transcriptional regulator n=1 Tax=Flavobacterium aquatile TaxID=245 RepID=UPI00068FCAAC|nr:helix-turn-helix domain-containing protein [Flavobacterium aquatile]OXA66994.1 hypothetical protein B0A61_09630 [Flavobacterium aquatile LMG 4008 = ATCC 11947]